MATAVSHIEHTLEAEYASIRNAEQAVSALEWAGIEPANVNVEGPAVERAFYRRDTQQRDTKVAQSMIRRAGIGVLIGATFAGLSGGIIGLIVGRAYGLSGYDAWLTSGLGALLGGIIGTNIGAFIGGEMALNINEAAEFKFEEDTHEPALVRVQVTDEKAADRALTILRAKKPMSVQHLENGRPAAA